MSPGEVAAIVRLRLASELADDLSALERLTAAIESLQAPAGDERGEWMRTLALAFEVERYYTAAEGMLSRIVRTLDGDVPTGPASHLELLRAATATIEGVRPAILDPATSAELRELLKFRHLARHGYEVEPDLTRMVEHAARVARIQPGLAARMAELARWLRDASAGA